MRLHFVLGALFATVVLEVAYGFSPVVDKFIYIGYIATISGLSFALGWLMRGNKTMDDEEDFEPDESFPF